MDNSKGNYKSIQLKDNNKIKIGTGIKIYVRMWEHMMRCVDDIIILVENDEENTVCEKISTQHIGITLDDHICRWTRKLK